MSRSSASAWRAKVVAYSGRKRGGKISTRRARQRGARSPEKARSSAAVHAPLSIGENALTSVFISAGQ